MGLVKRASNRGSAPIAQHDLHRYRIMTKFSKFPLIPWCKLYLTRNASARSSPAPGCATFRKSWSSSLESTPARRASSTAAALICLSLGKAESCHEERCFSILDSSALTHFKEGSPEITGGRRPGRRCWPFSAPTTAHAKFGQKTLGAGKFLLLDLFQ